MVKKGEKQSEEAREKISKNNAKHWLGRKHSEETKQKISKAQMGRRHSEERKRNISKSMIGVKHSEETKQKYKDWRRKQILPFKDSSIEIKIQNFLKQLNREFFTHQHMSIEHGYRCDIFIPSMNLVIECDGNYWHKYPTGRDIDHIRTSELIQKGFKVLRLWEFEINTMTIEEFKERSGANGS